MEARENISAALPDVAAAQIEKDDIEYLSRGVLIRRRFLAAPSRSARIARSRGALPDGDLRRFHRAVSRSYALERL